MSSYTQFSHLPDNNGKRHFPGSPNRGGLCYRICLTEWDVNAEWLRTEEKRVLPNRAYFLFEDIPGLIDAGVDTLKIQGREYSVPLVGKMVGLYRKLIDFYMESPGTFSLDPFKKELTELTGLRDRERTERTGSLIREAAN